jgi:predicted RNase H-like HicB family nuclease
MKGKKYLVVIEKAKNNYAAFSPDVWGCVATGDTVEQSTLLMKEALQFHIENNLETDGGVPLPKGISQHIAEGVFAEGEIAEKYFITEIEISVPLHA